MIPLEVPQTTKPPWQHSSPAKCEGWPTLAVVKPCSLDEKQERGEGWKSYLALFCHTKFPGQTSLVEKSSMTQNDLETSGPHGLRCPPTVVSYSSANTMKQVIRWDLLFTEGEKQGKVLLEQLLLTYTKKENLLFCDFNT